MQNETSENRKQDLIVQVKGMGEPSNFAYYAREAVVTEKKGWSDWSKIGSAMFQAIDKMARDKAGVEGAEMAYAEMYIEVIS